MVRKTTEKTEDATVALTETEDETAALTETKFSKDELLAIPSLTGATRDILIIALSDTQKYTYNEALKEADKFKGGLF
ncbi:hypothetical protein [Lactococcus lactis]|uniref:Uncharacterized protein n=1 Tax=Lactococcus lactis TaxID=1358 RepID=A0A6M0M7R4_9LACT|nr:hypothetical protein [Lactococcus lactis]NEX49347.1 hypothetical protein [Lactococcus lactis]NEX55401.1 hypothetical protein [Lactococcus lactis]